MNANDLNVAVSLAMNSSGYTNVFRLFDVFVGTEYVYSTNIAAGNNRQAAIALTENDGVFRTPDGPSEANVDELLSDIDNCACYLRFSNPSTCIDGEETVYVFGEKR